MPQQANQPLPAGYVLNGYRIEKPLSSGGFSIVYLARDESGTPFAIKEYLPSSLPLRTEGVEVNITDEANLAIFRHGLKCFFEEGRALAMISHANVVRVENFFRANETCYMVMQYVRGRTLQFHIQRNRSEFTEKFIRRLFAQLMNGLREVHANKLLHLDIKPANIFISMEGRPVLLDFGAARITLSEEAMKLKPMYTAGFAAPEHYRFKPGELGPWSDIYSVGATMYTCISGTPPQAGDQREEKDRIIPLRTLAPQGYSEDLYDIVDSCLAVDWLKRPQTAFDLQKRLNEEPAGEARKAEGFFERTINKPLSKLFSR
ncbi:MAG TPA: serine/threonine-protein kinase [Usitatibacter sp.]|nr:serine/threonine-protein kinase [Usitatibacter sp.]